MQTEIRFYHIIRGRLENVLANLLIKCLERQWNAHVLTEDNNHAELLCQKLWTFEERSFLPHATRKDGYAQMQPIWLSETDDNENNAHACFIINRAQPSNWTTFPLYCMLFDGNDQAITNVLREHWKTLTALSQQEITKDTIAPKLVLSYWQQQQNNTWKKQA